VRQSEPLPSPSSSGFRSTAWSLICDAREHDEETRAAALERLTRVYRRPVHDTLRHRWGFGPHDAEDLTQDYFSMLLEARFLEGVSPEKGRFRAYVKATLGNFVRRHHRARQAQRRGGAAAHGALDDAAAQVPDVLSDGPARSFDRALMRSLIREALQNLESECDGRGDEVGHPLFVAFYLGQSRGAASSYEDLARRFDLDLHQVKNRLAALRVAFRRHVLGLMRDGLSTEEELVAELREVFGG